MAPLDFTVDYNDATVGKAGTPSTPEVAYQTERRQLMLLLWQY